MSEFNGLKLLENRKLTKSEMIRALRKSIIEELKAIELYNQLSEASDDFLFQRIMNSIADEEKIHVGELMRMLFEFDNKEKDLYEDGFKEVEKFIKKPSKI